MKNLSVLFIALLSLTFAKTSSAQVEAHDFVLAKSCIFLDHFDGQPVKVPLEIYVADHNSVLVTFKGHAVEGTASDNGIRSLSAEANGTRISLRALTDSESTLLDFGGPRDNPADAYLNKPRMANTLLTYQSQNARGNAISLELKGECEFLMGTESIGAHN